jgi:hypothetical protein
MQRSEDAIEVRRGVVRGVTAPEQFLWKDRLWLVHEVRGHWTEPEARREQSGPAAREVWRVDAASGREGFRAGVASGQRGVFDLVFDDGAWRLQVAPVHATPVQATPG